MPEVRQNARGAIVIDDRYAPILITTFFGETNLELGKWFEEMNKKITLSQAAHGRRLISISDATAASKPSPEMRRFWADLSNNSSESMKNATLGTFIVIDNAVLRGAITAIGWLSPALRDLESFSTVDDAIREAMARLIKARLPLPQLAQPYQLPELAQAARTTFAR